MLNGILIALALLGAATLAAAAYFWLATWAISTIANNSTDE